MPSFYSPTYYEDRKREHDFYINLGNQCRIAEEQRQVLKKARMELQEQERRYLTLQEYNRKLDEAKRTLEKNRKLLHALKEYNYNKNRELVLLSDRVAWRDRLPFLSDNIKVE
jgi:ADP-heptose:LPS heptosyltransferase